MDAYVDWREESVRVWDAYDRWLSAAGSDAVLAFPAYVAALDREERASEVYAGLISRLDRVVRDAPPSASEHVAPASQASRP
jgi:hypothetical protein